MKKVILATVIGIIFLISGLLIALVLFEGMFDRNPLVLGTSILLVFLGMGILFYAGTRDVSKLRFKEIGISEGGKGVLDKNNKMVAQWENTNVTRDKLKVVQMAATDTQNPGS